MLRIPKSLHRDFGIMAPSIWAPLPWRGRISSGVEPAEGQPVRGAACDGGVCAVSGRHSRAISEAFCSTRFVSFQLDGGQRSRAQARPWRASGSPSRKSNNGGAEQTPGHGAKNLGAEGGRIRPVSRSQTTSQHCVRHAGIAVSMHQESAAASRIARNAFAFPRHLPSRLCCHQANSQYAPCLRS